MVDTITFVGICLGIESYSVGFLRTVPDMDFATIQTGLSSDPLLQVTIFWWVKLGNPSAKPTEKQT